jgi:hypothetical protein
MLLRGESETVYTDSHWGGSRTMVSHRKRKSPRSRQDLVFSVSDH